MKKIINLFKIDIWEIDDKKLPKSLKWLLNTARVVSLAVRGMVEDKIQLRASALTFYSILSVVPIIAMIFGIAKGFGLEQSLQAEILKNAEATQQEEVVKWLIGFAQSMLESTKGGVVAGVGVVLLLWSVMSILGNIEASFNDIWDVQKPRTYLRKFTDYMAIMILAPILLISSSSITIFISSTVNEIAGKVEVLSVFAKFTNVLLEFAPYFLIWIVFFLLYLIMPNTKVSWKAALTGGIIAGTSFQLFEWVYINFQVGVARYNAIYGSFAALPLFLIWLQTSWNLVLLGCEISFASQNYHRFAFEGSINNLSISFRKKIGLLMLIEINKNFEKGEITSKDFLAESLHLPPRLIKKIADDLQNAKLLVELEIEEELVGYNPARNMEYFGVKDYLLAFDQNGENNFPGFEEKNDSISDLHKHEQENTPIKNLIKT